MDILNKSIKNYLFRVKLAQDIINEMPEIAEDYKVGMTASQIKKKYNICNKFKVLDYKNNIDTAILMALGGFNFYENEFVKGLIPFYEYKEIANSNQIHKGVNLNKRLKKAHYSNDSKLLKKGILPYSDDEKYLIWLGMNSKELKDKKNRVKRKELTKIINQEIFNGKNIRKDYQIRNIMTQYTNARKKGLIVQKY